MKNCFLSNYTNYAYPYIDDGIHFVTFELRSTRFIANSCFGEEINTEARYGT
jgi:hypothetical protein